MPHDPLPLREDQLIGRLDELGLRRGAGVPSRLPSAPEEEAPSSPVRSTKRDGGWLWD